MPSGVTVIRVAGGWGTVVTGAVGGAGGVIAGVVLGGEVTTTATVVGGTVVGAGATLDTVAFFGAVVVLDWVFETVSALTEPGDPPLFPAAIATAAAVPAT